MDPAYKTGKWGGGVTSRNNFIEHKSTIIYNDGFILICTCTSNVLREKNFVLKSFPYIFISPIKNSKIILCRILDPYWGF